VLPSGRFDPNLGSNSVVVAVRRPAVNKLTIFDAPVALPAGTGRETLNSPLELVSVVHWFYCTIGRYTVRYITGKTICEPKSTGASEPVGKTCVETI